MLSEVIISDKGKPMRWLESRDHGTNGVKEENPRILEQLKFSLSLFLCVQVSPSLQAWLLSD